MIFYLEETIKTKNSSQHFMGTDIISYQQELTSTNFDLKSLKSSHQLKDIPLILNQKTQKLQDRLMKLFKNERDLFLRLEKEKEKNDYLQKELQKKDSFRSRQGEYDSQQDIYIEDLEMQLQELRASLLDKKLKITDKDEEIKILKKQVESLSHNFNMMDHEKKEIDQLVHKVTQQLKSKEMDMSQYSYSFQQEKDHLCKQIDFFQKQLHEEKQKNKNIELVEGDLIHKL